jgi:tetratricopeptide (TPR) repeat protein/tRNA A-37 threonylcarbamoyl transferase component Bud32
MSAGDPSDETQLAIPASSHPALADAATLLPAGSLGSSTHAMRPPTGEVERSALRRGSALGRYVVIDVLGRGGMGVVYSAYDPELDRKIAVKLVKWERGSDPDASTGRSRLLREAQALARLSHRNVVAVFDVGTYEDSIFVAMEYVDGRTLGGWVEEHKGTSVPPWRDVLEVFVPAGRALQAAHEAGIIHRDFKPENVMIDGTGRVVVLDFGLARPSVARASGSWSSDEEPVASLSTSSSLAIPLTVTGSVMGTPAYMSPEQLAGRETDAATDQFSFCVSLYAALYGERPFAGETMAELTSAVFKQQVRPPPKGTRVPPWVRRAVVKGLSRRPEERHASMDALLAALLDDPARRRRRVYTGAVAIGVLVAAAFGVRAWRAGSDPCAELPSKLQAAWGPDHRAALEAAFRSDAKTYSEETLGRTVEALDDWGARWLRLRTEACTAGRQAGGPAATEAGVRAVCLDGRLGRLDALVRVLGEADQKMVEKALGAVERLPEPERCEDSAADRRPPPQPSDPDAQKQVEALRVRKADVFALVETGRLEEAREIADALLAEAREIGFEPLIAEMAQQAGSAALQFGRYDEARALLEEAVLGGRAHGLDHVVLDALHPLVFIHTTVTSKHDLAEWILHDAEAMEKQFGELPVSRAEILMSRARLERAREKPEKSAEALEEADAIFTEHGGPGMSRVVTLDDLAASYMQLDRPEDALVVLDRAETIAAETLGPAHPLRGNILTHKARARSAQRRHDEAVDLLRAAIVVFEGAYGEVHPNIGAVYNGLGLALDDVARSKEAADAFARGREVIRKALGEEHPQVAIVSQNLGNVLRRLGRAEEAVPLHREAVAIREKTLPPGSEKTLESRDNLGDDLRMLGRWDEAEAEYRLAISGREQLQGTDVPELAYPLTGLGLVQLHRGDAPAAIATVERAVSLLEKGDDYRDALARARFALAIALRTAGRDPERADALLDQARAHLGTDARAHAPLLEQLEDYADGKDVGTLRY